MYDFLLLLGVAIAVRYLGRRLVPLLMPPGRLKTIAVGLVGGFIGSLVVNRFHFGDWSVVARTNLLGAAIGAAFFILLLGVIPFLKILFGRV